MNDFFIYCLVSNCRTVAATARSNKLLSDLLRNYFFLLLFGYDIPYSLPFLRDSKCDVTRSPRYPVMSVCRVSASFRQNATAIIFLTRSIRTKGFLIGYCQCNVSTKTLKKNLKFQQPRRLSIFLPRFVISQKWLRVLNSVF